MDPLIWLLRVASLALALLAGWMFGRTTPQWQEDAFNDTARPGAYGGFNPGSRAIGGGGTAGCGIFAAMTGGQGRWAWGLLFIASFVMASYAWPHPPGLRGGGNEPQYLFFQFSIWAPLVAFAIGYIPSALSDKGPVGPLE